MKSNSLKNQIDVKPKPLSNQTKQLLLKLNQQEKIVT